jgi:hypothetical protein
LSGCGGGWRRICDVSPQGLPTRTQVQVWQGDQVTTTLHSVLIDSYSVRGIPFVQRPDCDSCRVAIPLEEVDSIRTGSKELGLVRTVRIMLLVGTGMALVFRDVGGD